MEAKIFIHAACLGGLAMMCLPSDQRFAGSNQPRLMDFLRAIKIHRTTSFGREVRCGVPYHTFMACE
jgi:hypothetical protein